MVHRLISGAVAFSAVVLVFLFSSCTDRVDVYYTASLDGNLLGCDCRGYPEAGLDKRVWYLKENPMPEGALLLDAGNVLETGRDPYLASLILKTYDEMGYTAAAVGTNELAEGIEALVERSEPDESPLFISHNLMVRETVDSPERPLSGEPLIHRDGDIRIAVTALADPGLFNPYMGLFKGQLSVADPLEVLKTQMKLSAEAGAEALILLAHGREEWIRGLMEELDIEDSGEILIAAVILAGEDKLIEDRLPRGIPLVSPGEEGNRLGVLELKLHKHRRPGWKNEFIGFHYLGLGDRTVAARGAEYAEYLDAKRPK
jgi:2',3'-cyclic-nucleotide 2'-phosphodiesterase (5'-nucleotidase family)